MNDRGPWKTDDFDALSWHDVHVHGFFLDAFNEELGCADLVLDIDYILAWENNDGKFQFTVCQATLRFHEVFGLKFKLDYATPTAGMGAFSLAGVQREALSYQTGYSSYRWRLEIDWPQGYLEFTAPAFTQTLIGVPHVQEGQWLSQEKRVGRSAV